MSERLRKTGAIITVASAAYLGGVTLKSADAQPLLSHDYEQATDAEAIKPLPQVKPKEVQANFSETNTQREIQEALSKMTTRWDGVIVLHAPAKNAWVSFNESPSNFNIVNSDLSVTGKTDIGGVAIDRPYIINFKVRTTKGGSEMRTYAVVQDKVNQRWGFLDIGFAEDMGALSTYAFKGTNPKPVRAYNSGPPTDFPVEYEWFGGVPTKGQPLDVTFHYSGDVSRSYLLKPSSVVPHA
ncbi:MAG: hypothetical protein ACREGG_01685 [Candidatus Saccharimonadales bacterium]